MATIAKYETDAGLRYRVRYRKPDGKQTDKRGFRTKKEAEAFANTVEVSKLRGEFVTEAAGRVTVGELWPRWIATKQGMKESYKRTLNVAYSTHVEAKWGAVPVGKVKRSEVREWVHGMAKSASVSRRAHGILAGILDLAVDDKAVHANVARGIPLPRKVRQKHAYLTVPQLATLASHAKANAGMVWFLGTTGLRWGEAVALRGKHVDRERRRIRVEVSATMVGSTLVPDTPKGGVARDVPVTKFALERIPKALPEAVLLPVPSTGRMRTYSPGSESWFSGALSRAQAEDPKIPDLVIHDLRHTAASIAISSGANVKAVQRMLGHTSAAMTLDVYSDLFEADLDAVADAIEAKLAAECGQNVGTGAAS
ncbi:site-specific integrase [Pseudoclavibacter sp. AY1H1]|uniref:site-specific integrase n=1 Tax=Pseudoclavibacter sp. AY1H1 TaxID=2080584 RepID=UPI000CE7D56E|nr:site-specific integrase [Pseudoclavibacter sp. AY1H1]PPF38379.1 site-specific integrase [Pseudoclavibacter sp. AY1H1]